MTMPPDPADRLRALLEADQRLRDSLADSRGASRRALPALQRGAAHRESVSRHATPAVAAQAWRDARPAQGWVLHQSGQAAFDASHPLPDTASWGALLAAEAADAEGRSLRLARDPAGAWVLTLTRHDDQGEGVWDEVRHRASAPGFGDLCYRRYWHIDAQGRLAVQSAHFFGFLAASA